LDDKRTSKTEDKSSLSISLTLPRKTKKGSEYLCKNEELIQSEKDKKPKSDMKWSEQDIVDGEKLGDASCKRSLIFCKQPAANLILFAK